MQISQAPYQENYDAALASLEDFYTQGAEVPASSTSAYVAADARLSLVATDNGVVVGRLCASYDPVTNSARIELLFVDASQRGQGVGKKLAEDFEQSMRANGVTTLFVDTTESSAPKFYEKLGYTLIGTIPNYPVAPETYLLMMKRVQ